jgi:hypothetical protein
VQGLGFEGATAALDGQLLAIVRQSATEIAVKAPDAATAGPVIVAKGEEIAEGPLLVVTGKVIPPPPPPPPPPVDDYIESGDVGMDATGGADSSDGLLEGLARSTAEQKPLRIAAGMYRFAREMIVEPRKL